MAEAPLASPPARVPFVHPSQRLRELGRRARKRLSQSFLADPRVAIGIVRAARIERGVDEVLEVGPGLGILTERLTPRASRVLAVELDPDLAAWLPEAIPAPNLEVVQANILHFDPGAVFSEPYSVVANLPYHITSPAIRHLLAAGPPVAKRLVLMVQREVAERLMAGPGSLSALAVATQVQASIGLALRVPRRAFFPAPKVDSSVIVLVPLPDDERLIARTEVEPFTEFLHAGFAQPRKRLDNSLAQGLRMEKAAAAAAIERAGIDPAQRPQQLAVEDWVRLFRQHADA